MSLTRRSWTRLLLTLKDKVPGSYVTYAGTFTRSVPCTFSFHTIFLNVAQSPKVADVLRAGGRSRGGADSDEEALVQSAEFQKMAREVELLGAAHLDKREKKKWEARALQQMGAKVRAPAESANFYLLL